MPRVIRNMHAVNNFNPQVNLINSNAVSLIHQKPYIQKIKNKVLPKKGVRKNCKKVKN